jgi:hypothetical protein
MKPLTRSLCALPLLLLVLATVPCDAATLTNGSFETGNFVAYTKDAFLDFNAPMFGLPSYETFFLAQTNAGRTTVADSNAVVMSQTTTFDGAGTPGPAIGPTDGSFLAFLSNETLAGDGSLTGSSISQTFTIPMGSTVFSFDIGLLNDDVSTTAGFDDFGGLALLSGSNVLNQYNIDLVGGANAQVQTGTAAGGFLNSAPFRTVSFDVSSLQGQTITVVAYVTQFGDNTTESRLLLDNLRLSTPVTVPEPGPAVLLLAPALWLAKKRHSVKLG